MAVVVLVEPLMMYKHYWRIMPFSLSYYFHQAKYAFFVAIPVSLFQFLYNWLEGLKHKRGYCWVGKFEVVNKYSLFMFCFLALTPGRDHRVKVDRKLFRKVRVGDSVVIRRDALGKLEKVIRVRRFSTSRKNLRSPRDFWISD
jgi:hypothetical protein